MFCTLAAACVLCLAGDCSDKEPKEEVDPLVQQARLKYAEGRRLFLTCDPNNYEKALALFEDALAYQEEYPEAMAAWSETISMWYGFMLPEEIFQTAYMRSQRSIRLDPELDMGYRAMADLFRHRRDPETGELDNDYALEVIERAITINPNSAENLYVKGSIYLSRDPDKAAEVLEKAKRLNPNLGKVYFNLAAAHQTVADQRYTAAAERGGDIPEDVVREVRDLYRTAVDYLDTYQKLVPGDLGGYASRGIILMRLSSIMPDGPEKNEMIAEAEKNFQQAVGRDQKPDPSQMKWVVFGYYYLAKIEMGIKNDPEAALDYVERGIEFAPRNIDLVGLGVEANRVLGDQEAVKKYQEKFREAMEKKSAVPGADGSTAEAPPVNPD